MSERTIVKKVKNAVLFSDGTIRLDNVRFSYPNLAKPYVGKNDDGKETARYSVVAILPKSTHEEAKKLCVERLNELLKENKIDKIGADKKFIRNGDDAAKDEYENAYTVSAGETKMPDLRGKGGKEKLTQAQAEELFYGGMYGHTLIRPWFQNSQKWGKRVNAGLVAAVFHEHGEPFGDSRITAKDVDDSFDDLDEDGAGLAPGDDDDL
jgi:hypothetical protein